ncbi:MAG: hypothetical protein ACWGOX_14960 [Desulforhopalus sp.]
MTPVEDTADTTAIMIDRVLAGPHVQSAPSTRGEPSGIGPTGGGAPRELSVGIAPLVGHNDRTLY